MRFAILRAERGVRAVSTGGRPISVQKAQPVSTALIPIAPSEIPAPAGQGSGRPRADFLAQLIATLAQAPQTRMRRRAEPADAIAAYRMNGRSPKPAGQALSRSL